MLVDREATGTLLSDASYFAVGGWSPAEDLNAQWRVLRVDLIAFGFPMKAIHAMQDEPLFALIVGLHINPLEFIAVIINLWLGIRLILARPAPLGGRVLLLMADNTTALSWLRFAATTKSAVGRCLARLCTALLLYAFRHGIKVQNGHIAGKLNDEADTLSRSERGQTPSWARVTELCSRLEHCRICLLPRGLLSKLAEMLSSQRIEVLSDEETTALMTLDYGISDVGSMASDLTSSLYDP
jgi:hypothetical protein